MSILASIVAHLYAVFSRLGGFGLLALGLVDSSFLFLPLGNDLLVVAMAARRHRLAPYYAFMASLGSVLGCVLVDAVSRKGGEKGLERMLSRKRLQYVMARVKKNAAWALSIASLMPPPFPFTPVVAGASALQYPRKKLLAVVAVNRFVRFFTEALLAVLFGRHILAWARSRPVEYAVILLIVVSVGGSVISVYEWLKKSKSPKRRR